DQRGKSCVNVLDPALAAPVALGREVDHPAWVRALPDLDDQHAARLYLAPLARSLIRREVLWIGALELRRDAATHDADAVHRIDQRLRVGLQDVASGDVDHESHLYR